MHNHKFIRQFLRFSGRISAFLPSLFWFLLIFGFGDPAAAIATVLAAIIHEAGHEAVAFMYSGSIYNMRGTLSGFRIKRLPNASYMSDFLLYSSGPLANILVSLPFLFLPFFSREYTMLFVTVNLATAISNLLPIRGYDGYGILKTLILKSGKDESLLPILDNLSFIFIVTFTFLSLYIVGRIGSSYWMAGLFIISLIGEVGARLRKVFP